MPAESDYHAMHRRLDAMRLPAKYHPCAWCLLTADQWAYLWNDPNEYHGTGRVHRVWSEDSRNYVAMCRSCHKLMDNAHRRVGREELANAIAPLKEAAYAAVNSERRAVEARGREASAKAAHAFLDAQDMKPRRSRLGRPPASAVRATHALMCRAYARGSE